MKQVVDSRPTADASQRISAAVSVVGGGAWGLALASAAASAGSDVLLYSRRALEGLPERVRTTTLLNRVAEHAPLLIVAVPSHAVRKVAYELGAYLDGHHMIVHGVRGLESRRIDSVDGADGCALGTISRVIREETPVRRVGALGGPVLTSELAAGAPSVIVVGTCYPEVADAVRKAFATPALRIYETDDLIGLEWASALTAILAIAVGFARGVGLGAGIVAAFVTRGVQEAARVAEVVGGHEKTFLGLGGFGDLLAAIAGSDRPEVRLGEAIARGEKIRDVLDDLGERIEAIELAPRVAAFARSRALHAPILEAIASGILAERPAEDIVRQLMTAPLTHRA